MAIQALQTAATGMKAMDFKLNVIANNLANVETVGFKRSRPEFADVLYQTLEEPGLRNGLDQALPTGKQIGLGVDVAGTQLDFQQGAPLITKGQFDLLINGDGFFQVQAFIDGSETTTYTRAGNFTQNADGDLVLDNGIGARLEPTITIPQDAIEVQISTTGLVSARVSGTTTFQDVGQLELARFINPAGLKQIGDNLFRDTPASGDPITGNPKQDAFGSIEQGQLELSNVEPVTELVQLIRTQRSFELNSQSLQSADQTLQTLVNMARF